MSPVPTGGSVCCLSWNARYAASFYNSLPSDLVNGVFDDVHRPDVAYFNEEGDSAGAGES